MRTWVCFTIHREDNLGWKLSNTKTLPTTSEHQWRTERLLLLTTDGMGR